MVARSSTAQRRRRPRSSQDGSRRHNAGTPDEDENHHSTKRRTSRGKSAPPPTNRLAAYERLPRPIRQSTAAPQPPGRRATSTTTTNTTKPTTMPSTTTTTRSILRRSRPQPHAQPPQSSHHQQQQQQQQHQPPQTQPRQPPPQHRRQVSLLSSDTNRAVATASDASSSLVLVSPTHVTHATPRPKSPRRPNFSAAQWQSHHHALSQPPPIHGSSSRSNSAQWRARSVSPGPRHSHSHHSHSFHRLSSPPAPHAAPLLAAQHFAAVAPLSAQPQQPKTQKRQPPQIAASWSSPGRSTAVDGGDASSTASATTNSTEDEGTSADTTDPHRQASSSSSPRQQRRRRQRPTTTTSRALRSGHSSLLRGCIAGGLYGGAVVGSKFTECFYLTTDIYQQECGTHHAVRDDDALFLQRRSGTMVDDDDDDGILATPPQGPTQTKKNPSTPPRRGGRPSGEANHPNPTTEERSDATPQTPFRSNRRSDLSQSLGGTTTQEPPYHASHTNTPSTHTTPTRRSYHRHRDSFDVAPHGIAYDQGELPRLHAVPRRGSPSWTHPTGDHGDTAVAVDDDPLRNVRLQLFQQGPATPRPSPVWDAPPAPQRLALATAGTTTSSNTLPLPLGQDLRHSHPRNRSWDGSSLGVAEQEPPTSFPPWRPMPPNHQTRSSAAKTADPIKDSHHSDDPDSHGTSTTLLRRELHDTKASLERARQDLQHAQDLRLRHQADTRERATQLTTEKLAAETQVRQQEREKQALLSRLTALQEETAQLKTNLQQVMDEQRRTKSPRAPLSPPVVQLNKSLADDSVVSDGSTQTGPAPPLAASLGSFLPVAPPLSSGRSPSSPKKTMRKTTAGSVLDLVREVVGMSKGTTSSSSLTSSSSDKPRGEHSDQPISPPAHSPVSVLDVHDDENGHSNNSNQQGDALLHNEADFVTPPRNGTERTLISPPPTTGSPFLSSQLIELKSDLIELRSQLAEANAAKVQAEAERGQAVQAREVVQAETKKLRDEVNELKELVLQLKLAETQKEERFETQVQQAQQELAQSRQVAEAEKKAKERLEEELTETQNETDELRNQVARFMKELEKTKSESEQKVQVSESEAKKLQEELRLMKFKLSKTNAEIVQQASEHLQSRRELAAELEQSKATSTALQKRVLFMDDQLLHTESATKDFQDELRSTTGDGSLSSPPRLSWKEKLGGMATTLSRSLSNSTADATEMVPEEGVKTTTCTTRASVMSRIRQSLDENSPDVLPE